MTIPQETLNRMAQRESRRMADRWGDPEWRKKQSDAIRAGKARKKQERAAALIAKNSDRA